MNPFPIKKYLSLGLIAIFALLVAGGFVLWQRKLMSQNQTFPVAPGNTNSDHIQASTSSTPSLISENKATSTPSSLSGISTADWRTYRNGKYGFELKYPIGWQVESADKKQNVSTSGSLRFFIAAEDAKIEELITECKKNDKLPQCVTETYTPGIFLEISNKQGSLDFETYFREKVAPELTINDNPEEIIKNSKKEQIGSLNLIKGNLIDVTGWPYYSFSNPAGNSLFLAKGGEPEEIFRKILSTFKFLESFSFNGKSCIIYSKITNPYKNGEQIIVAPPCGENEYDYSIFVSENGSMRRLSSLDEQVANSKNPFKFIDGEEMIYEYGSFEGGSCSGGGTASVDKIDLRNGTLATVANSEYYASSCHDGKNINRDCVDEGGSFSFQDKKLFTFSLVCQNGVPNKEFKAEFKNKVLVKKDFPYNAVFNFSAIDNAYDLLKGDRKLKFILENKPYLLNIETGKLN